MSRIGVILVAVALALAACEGPGETVPATETGGATAGTGGATAGTDDRAVAVYSEVIRRLVTEDHTFGAGESPFDRVFVDVRIDRRADDPVSGPHPGPELTADVQAAILRELADLPPTEFVADPDSVIVGEGCPHVKGSGVLITLGPISGGAGRVTVPNGMFIACLGGQWLTYVLKRVDDDWHVVGTRGPVVIS